MGTSKSSKQLVTKITKAQKELTSNAAAMNKVAFAAKTILLGELGSAVGSDLKLSGVGKSGVKLGVRYDVKGRTNATALLKATGPWQLIERDTKPHTIRPRSRRRKAGKKALAINGEVRASAQHPGTRGKEPWAKGRRKVEEVAVRLYQREAVREPLRRIFG